MKKKVLNIREDLLDLSSIQNMHIGGDLSIADAMTVLWQYKMNYNSSNPTWKGRDRFVLSKGHASDEGMFSMHPCKLINPYVDFSTGSLGHGMPVATGIAAGLKLSGNYESRVYTIMGDGEQAEGSIWEAVMNSAHYQFGNLVAILDYNKIEGDGFIKDISGLGNIPEKYRVFGWEVFEIDGNNVEELIDVFDNLPDPREDKPILVACHTIKGKGVAYMENQIKWHTGFKGTWMSCVLDYLGADDCKYRRG